jgi:hypothetical protein
MVDEEWSFGSTFLDEYPPQEVMSMNGVRYVLDGTIDRNENQGSIRSHSFRATVGADPKDFVFIKFGPASMINHEWKAAMKIRQSIGNECPFLVRPIDRSPLDGFLVTNGNPESGSDDSEDSTAEARLHFIVSPLIHGEDMMKLLLHSMRENEPFERSSLMLVLAQIVAALAVLHKIGMVHCDIKPETLMWDEVHGRVKLIDFEHCTQEGQVRSVSTAGYCPPEAEGGVPVKPSWDIYSLGITFMVLWTRAAACVFRRRTWVCPRDMNNDFGTIVRRMIDHCPEKRPTAEELCQELMGCVG